MNRGVKAEPTPPECALAAEMFDHFCSAITMKQILSLHREICNTLNLKPNRLPEFYPKLKAKLASSWKAQALFKKFDARANHKVYGKGKICSDTKVLIIGAGPCGLRAAIECQLLGSKVVVIEKRDRLSRNNVLHLWPFVIHDLRALGAKKFYGKFCAGSINHICIRQLQCILMKVSLLLGVEIYEGIAFEELLQPSVSESKEILGWRARVSPDHPVSQYEFDVLIGADGKRNTLKGFKKNEFRGKLAIGITANFINRHTEQEAAVPEISGVAYIFYQKFFKDLSAATGIDLENIVYYKDDTHYFVMTAKKQSLIKKGVLVKDYPEVSRLLNKDNMDKDALMRYAQEAARFSTNGRLPTLDFALNHCGEPDVALFDFSAMYTAENASIVYERIGRRLLCQLVGDSLMEPFWPTGSGCARGFLSALDASWAVRSWGQNPPTHPLLVIAERESIYRLLPQTTTDNLQRDLGAYTLDPGTRYPNLNRTAVSPTRVTSYYQSDDPLPLDTASLTKKRRRDPEISEEALIAWVGYSEPGLREAASPQALNELVKRYRPDLLLAETDESPQNIYKLLHKSFGIPLLANQLNEVPDSKIRSYLTRVYYAFKGEVPHIQHECNMFSELKENQKKNSLRYSINQNASAYSHAAESDKSHSAKRKRRIARSPQGEGKSINEPLKASGSGIRVARLAAELSNTSAEPSAKASKPKDLMRSVGKISQQDWNVKQIEKKITENRLGRPEPTSAERVPKWDREQFLGRQRRLQEGDSNDEKWEEIDVTIQKIDQKLHDTGRPLHGTKKVAKLAKKFVIEDAASSQPSTSQTNEQNLESSKKVWRGPPTGKQCPVCEQRVYAAEGITADGLHLHRACFRCAICNTVLRPGNYTRERYGIRLVCLRHYATHVPESVLENLSKRDFDYVTPQHTPERIYIELSDNGGREIDEDEWTDRNFFTSEASAAGELSDDSSPEENVDGEDNEAEEDRSEAAEEAPRPPPSDMYLSDDSYGYDDYSDDGAESSNESLSNMREAREARRREVPADAPPPYTSSEMESDEDSDSSDDEKSSATEVSTDSEFAREESVAIPSPPAILVTEVPSLVVPPPQDYPISRTKSAGGLATKRALELKRKYLLGEPSPPTVRKSESTSQLDSKLEAFRSNITEFQKMLHPATPAPQTVSPYLTYQLTNEEKKPRPDIPDIIKNLCNNVPVDLLTKGDSPLCKKDWNEPIKDEKEPDLETDSLSDDSSESETVPNKSVPRVEVHDEGGELIQLDSLILVSNIIDDAGEKISGTATDSGPTVVEVELESSESGKDATTLALTETELSDWAAESVVLDECGIDDNGERNRNKNPRTLSGPKLIHDAKNIESISTHVCGRNSPELVVYSNAPEHFEFADEGDQDPSIAVAPTPCNDGYMELVDDDYEPYSTSKDRSMNFIERVYSDTTIKSDPNDTLDKITSNLSETLEFLDSPESKSESILLNDTEIMSKPLSTSNSSENMQQLTNIGNDSSSSSYKVMKNRNDSSLSLNEAVNSTKIHLESLSLMDNSPSLLGFMDKKNVSTSESAIRNGNYIDDLSPPVVSEKITYTPSITSPIQMHATRSHNLRTYSPAICRSASETFNGANSRSMISPSHDKNWSISTNFSNPVAENHSQVNKVQELKREREEQTEVVRRLVLERLGGAKVCRKSTRRNRVSPSSFMPPPIPPPPLLPAPPSPVLGASHMPILPPSNFPAVPPRPSTHPRTSISLQSSFSDPELTRQHRPKSFIKSISNYFNKRLGPRYKQNNQERLSSKRTLEAPPVPPPPVDARSQMSVRELRAPPVPPPPVERTPHISVKAPPVPPPPVSNEAPPVPPPPACYSPPCDIIETHAGSSTQTINESIRRASDKRDHCCHRRLEKLERRLSRQLSAADEAATVAEILELSARHDAHEAMNTAVGRRNAASSSVGD